MSNVLHARDGTASWMSAASADTLGDPPYLVDLQTSFNSLFCIHFDVAA
jgi:hypothetical protein